MSERAYLLAAAVLLAGTARAGPNAVGVGLSNLSPGGPLGGGFGVHGRYTRDLRLGAAAPVGADRAAGPWRLETSLGLHEVDRDAQGTLPRGDVRIVRGAATLLRRFGQPTGGWSLAAGAGLDVLTGDGDETSVIPAPIGIGSTYEIDTGIGFHAKAGALRSLGTRWELFLDVGYLFADLDGAQRFVVSGVEGGRTEVSFDLGGPELHAGAAYRF